MNYVPLNRKANPSLVSTPISSQNSSSLFKPHVDLPRPRLNLAMNGHSHPQKSSTFSPIIPFGTMMPITRGTTPLNNVQQKLAALTLRLEKELESESTVGDYFGQCTKCGEPVTSAADACQAMGELYHNDCFKCVVCARILRGKSFYRIHDNVYCEEDYLVNFTPVDFGLIRCCCFFFSSFSLQDFNKRSKNVLPAII